MSLIALVQAAGKNSGALLGGAAINFGDDLARFTAQYGDDLSLYMGSKKDFAAFLSGKADDFKLAGYSDEFLSTFQKSAETFRRADNSIRNVVEGFKTSGAKDFNAYINANSNLIKSPSVRAFLKQPKAQQALLKTDDIAEDVVSNTANAGENLSKRQVQNILNKEAKEIYKESKLSRFGPGKFGSGDETYLSSRAQELGGNLTEIQKNGMRSKAMNYAENGGRLKRTGMWAYRNPKKTFLGLTAVIVDGQYDFAGTKAVGGFLYGAGAGTLNALTPSFNTEGPTIENAKNLTATKAGTPEKISITDAGKYKPKTTDAGVGTSFQKGVDKLSQGDFSGAYDEFKSAANPANLIKGFTGSGLDLAKGGLSSLYNSASNGLKNMGIDPQLANIITGFGAFMALKTIMNLALSRVPGAGLIPLRGLAVTVGAGLLALNMANGASESGPNVNAVPSPLTQKL